MRSESKQSDYISDRICAGQQSQSGNGFETKQSKIKSNMLLWLSW